MLSYTLRKEKRPMKTTMTKQQETIRINEEFMPVDNRPLDSRHRVTLSDHVFKALTFKKIDSFQILVGENGDILLRPSVSIPTREVWIYENPKVFNMLRKAIQQVKEGKVTKVTDQQKFFDSL